MAVAAKYGPGPVTCHFKFTVHNGQVSRSDRTSSDYAVFDCTGFPKKRDSCSNVRAPLKLQKFNHHAHHGWYIFSGPHMPIGVSSVVEFSPSIFGALTDLKVMLNN